MAVFHALFHSVSAGARWVIALRHAWKFIALCVVILATWNRSALSGSFVVNLATSSWIHRSYNNMVGIPAVHGWILGGVWPTFGGFDIPPLKPIYLGICGSLHTYTFGRIQNVSSCLPEKGVMVSAIEPCHLSNHDLITLHLFEAKKTPTWGRCMLLETKYKFVKRHKTPRARRIVSDEMVREENEFL